MTGSAEAASINAGARSRSPSLARRDRADAELLQVASQQLRQLQHQWRYNKAPAAERYDVINSDRNMGKFREAI